MIAGASMQARQGLAPPAPSNAVAHPTATCADYPDQAAAQRAADARDGDGDGISCVIYSR
jgi:hypothetical protein